MFKNIPQVLKELYLKLSFACCCRSKCQIQLGQENSNINSENKNTYLDK